MSKEISKEKTNRLLNCPFCGGEALLRGFFFVQCIKCGVSTLTYLTEIDAIKAWNTRKPMQNIVEQLEEAMRECRNGLDEDYDFGMHQGLRDAIEIVREEGGMNERN